MAEDLNDRMTLSLDIQVCLVSKCSRKPSSWWCAFSLSAPWRNVFVFLKLGGDFIVATFTPPTYFQARPHRRLGDSRFLNDRCVEGDGLFGQENLYVVNNLKSIKPNRLFLSSETWWMDPVLSHDRQPFLNYHCHTQLDFPFVLNFVISFVF